MLPPAQLARDRPAAAPAAEPPAAVWDPTFAERLDGEFARFVRASPDVDVLLGLLAEILEHAPEPSGQKQVDQRGVTWWPLPAGKSGPRIALGRTEVNGEIVAHVRVQPDPAARRELPMSARGAAFEAEARLAAGSAQITGLVVNGIAAGPDALDALDRVGEQVLGHRFVLTDEGRLKVVRCVSRPCVDAMGRRGVLTDCGSDLHAVDVPTYVQPGAAPPAAAARQGRAP
ncbi:MAG: hypothetical protein U1E76_24885 [Planctomycetota bacterium]